MLHVLDTISALLALDDAERPCPELPGEVNSALARRDVLRSGQAHEPPVLDVLSAIHKVLRDDQCSELTERLIARSRELQQWNQDRRNAARTFADTWWQHRDDAKNQSLWQAVGESISDLEKEIREQRESQLLAIVERTCTGLLGDAQLSLSALGITQKTAAPEFASTADGAAPRPLGALSAGQQNAFLLAPVIGPRSVRPFGFVVFDDPVHALDDFRIDVLARFLRERATTHQVIVFTHDERLTEILRHSASNGRFYTLKRDHANSVVTVEQDEPLWMRLLNACSSSLNPKDAPATVRPGIARALMRQAVDAALRDALIKHLCDHDTIGAKDALRNLGNANRTSDRFAHLQNVYAGTELARRATDARTIVANDLGAWSRATHRDEPIGRSTVQDERKRAWKACSILAATNAPAHVH